MRLDLSSRETRVFCVGILSVLTAFASILPARAASDLPPPESKLPVPCDTALKSFALTRNPSDKLYTLSERCSSLFSGCGSATAPGVTSDIKDLLIRQVVGNRLQNLYKGFNGLSSLSSRS